MRKRSDRLLKEYLRTNKTATSIVNNIHVPKPEPLEMARFSERERRGITNYFNCFWLGCLIGIHNTSLYSYGIGYPPLRWPLWPSGFNYKARPTAPTRPRRPQINFFSTNYNSQHFIPGMGRATRKLPNSVILSHKKSTIPQIILNITNDIHSLYAIWYIIWLYTV